MVDTQGLILGVFVTAANLDDREGLLGVVQKVKPILKRLQVIWADSGYQGSFLIPGLKCRIEIIKRNEKGFKVLPRRWVVERTFAWLGKQRRLGKDYEYRTTHSENMILLGMLKTTLRVCLQSLNFISCSSNHQASHG